MVTVGAGVPEPASARRLERFGIETVAKEFDSAALVQVLYFALPTAAKPTGAVMSERTCAACDCKLDANSIKVKLGGKVVEVCCTECAEKLKEAQDSAAAPDEA